MDNEQRDRARVFPGVTLSDNYNRLKNKPTLNGITIQGDMSSESLNVLDNRVEQYEQVTVRLAQESFLLVLGESKEPQKIKLQDVTVGRFTTARTITDDVQIGSYVFKEMED